MTISRQEVLDAFEALVARHGLDRVTMKELAWEAGVSVGSIYRHFDSKDELILSVEEKWRGHVDTRNAAIVDGSGSPAEKLHELVVTHVERFSGLVRENRAVYELLRGATRLRYIGRTVTDTRTEIFDSMTASVAEVLEEGNGRGDFAVDDVALTARLFVDAFTEYFSPEWVMEQDHADVVARAEGMFALLVRGLRAG